MLQEARRFYNVLFSFPTRSSLLLRIGLVRSRYVKCGTGNEQLSRARCGQVKADYALLPRRSQMEPNGAKFSVPSFHLAGMLLPWLVVGFDSYSSCFYDLLLVYCPFIACWHVGLHVCSVGLLQRFGTTTVARRKTSRCRRRSAPFGRRTLSCFFLLLGMFGC